MDEDDIDVSIIYCEDCERSFPETDDAYWNDTQCPKCGALFPYNLKIVYDDFSCKIRDGAAGIDVDDVAGREIVLAWNESDESLPDLLSDDEHDISVTEVARGTIVISIEDADAHLLSVMKKVLVRVSEVEKRQAHFSLCS